MKPVQHTNYQPRPKPSRLRIILIILLILFVVNPLVWFLVYLGSTHATFGVVLMLFVLAGIAYAVIWGFGSVRDLFSGGSSPKKRSSDAITLPEGIEINHSVQILNPYAGIFISGGAGSGKSKSLIEPIIYDAGRKNFTGVVYDFKFPELARHVESAYQKSSVHRYYVNFTDLQKTHRINPIAPEIMRSSSFAREFASTVLYNINPQSVSRPDFWSDNSQSLLSAVFWYLRQEKPEFCTLPHAISLVLQPNTSGLIRLLQSNEECSDMVAPIFTALQSKAENQFAGVLSSLQVALGKINTPKIYYVTGQGNDLYLGLNDPNHPGILTIGNDPVLSTTYGPVIGLILTAITKMLNQPGKEKSLVLLDEFPTVFVPNFESLPATARSNRVATVLVCQDITQMIDKYGKGKADTILSNLGNQFYGRTTNPQTAQRVSAIFGKADKLMPSDSTHYDRTILGDRNRGGGQSVSYQERELVRMQEVTGLETGSFYAVLSEGKVRQGKSVIPLNKVLQGSELPLVSEVSQEKIDSNFRRIRREAQDLVLSLE